MQITIGQQPLEGKFMVEINFTETIDRREWVGNVLVWVPYVDSVKELHKAAIAEAKNFLQRTAVMLQSP